MARQRREAARRAARPQRSAAARDMASRRARRAGSQTGGADGWGAGAASSLLLPSEAWGELGRRR